MGRFFSGGRGSGLIPGVGICTCGFFSSSRTFGARFFFFLKKRKAVGGLDTYIYDWYGFYWDKGFLCGVYTMAYGRIGGNAERGGVWSKWILNIEENVNFLIRAKKLLSLRYSKPPILFFNDIYLFPFSVPPPPLSLKQFLQRKYIPSAPLPSPYASPPPPNFPISVPLFRPTPKRPVAPQTHI